MATYTERQAGSKLADFISEHAQVLSIAMFFVLCILFFGSMTTTFLTTGNLLNVVRQAAPGILAAMRFTEHEMTRAMEAAAKSVLALRRANRRRDVEVVWAEMTRYQRYEVLDSLGDQVLPVLVALPDVEVAAGTRPTFTDAQITAAVQERMAAEGGGRLRRAVVLRARVALVQAALAGVPHRQDPDALVVPDHL